MRGRDEVDHVERQREGTGDESDRGSSPVEETFSVRSAAGSVPPLPTPLAWEEMERIAREEQAARVVREMRRP
jgi:hypothetical protein